MNDDCIEFIKNALIINPQKRFSAKELLDLDFLSTKRLQSSSYIGDNCKTLKGKSQKNHIEELNLQIQTLQKTVEVLKKENNMLR